MKHILNSKNISIFKLVIKKYKYNIFDKINTKHTDYNCKQNRKKKLQISN